MTLGGLPIAVVDRATAAAGMIREALARRGSGRPPLFVTSANGEVISICARDPDIARLFAAADVIHADGMPMVHASRLFCRRTLPERVATTDLFHDVARRAGPAGISFYMLGANATALERAVRNVRRLYPDLRLVGHHHGYLDDPRDEAAVVAEIDRAAPDILWIAQGVPREQRFIRSHRDRLRHVGVIKTAGGLFDFLSGDRARAPRWMQAAGLEWLYRLHLEPRRLLRRYALTNPHAALLLVTRSG